MKDWSEVDIFSRYTVVARNKKTGERRIFENVPGGGIRGITEYGFDVNPDDVIEETEHKIQRSQTTSTSSAHSKLRNILIRRGVLPNFAVGKHRRR